MKQAAYLLIELGGNGCTLTISIIDDTQFQSLENAPKAIPIAYLRDMGAQEAQAVVGGLVLAALEPLVEQGLGIAAMAAELEQSANRFGQLEEEKARAGDTEAQYQLAMHHYAESARKLDETRLAEAERWLKSAAANAHQRSIEALVDWDKKRALQATYIEITKKQRNHPHKLS